MPDLKCFGLKSCSGVALATLLMLVLAPVIAARASSDDSSAQVRMIESLLPGVVRITTHSLSGDPKIIDERESYGSGFVVDKSGYIVTNAHVINGAYEIIVTLNDGTVRHAKLVGEGGEVDLAVIKIETRLPLQPLRFAEGAEVRIGDEVFAVGNPYGIGTTVTKGIVSALNRDLTRSVFDSYIQTDAAINRGNSGGPLVNRDGEVVGVNTAYYKGPVEKGGFIGLGFAIPSTVVKSVVDLIRRYGYPKVGWFGIDGQTLSPEMGAALGLDHVTGAILVTVKNGGPSAGILEPDDIVLEIDGENVVDMRMLQRAAVSDLGRPIHLKILRKRKELNVVVKPWERPVEFSARPLTSSTPSDDNGSNFGLALTALTDERRTEFGMASADAGVSVKDVTPISAAAEAGLARGDIIESVQLHPMRSRDDVAGALANLSREKRDFALLRVRSRNQTRYLTLHLIWEGPHGASVAPSSK